jgi:hypothetical protein
VPCRAALHVPSPDPTRRDHLGNSLTLLLHPSFASTIAPWISTIIAFAANYLQLLLQLHLCSPGCKQTTRRSACGLRSGRGRQPVYFSQLTYSCKSNRSICRHQQLSTRSRHCLRHRYSLVCAVPSFPPQAHSLGRKTLYTLTPLLDQRVYTRLPPQKAPISTQNSTA